MTKLLNAHAVGGTDNDEENLCVIKRFPRLSHLLDSTNFQGH